MNAEQQEVILHIFESQQVISKKLNEKIEILKDMVFAQNDRIKELEDAIKRLQK